MVTSLLPDPGTGGVSREQEGSLRGRLGREPGRTYVPREGTLVSRGPNTSRNRGGPVPETPRTHTGESPRTVTPFTPLLLSAP